MKTLTQTLLAVALAAAYGGGFAQATPDQAASQKPGECSARIFTPPKFETQSEQVLKAPATKRTEVIPARFEMEEAPRADAAPAKLAQLHQEVAIARQVSHPHVCRVYDIGESEGQLFLSMEYVDGEDLAGHEACAR